MNKEFTQWLKEQEYSWNSIPKKIGADYSCVRGWILSSVIKDVIGERNMGLRPTWLWGRILEVEIGTDNKIKYERGFL